MYTKFNRKILILVSTCIYVHVQLQPIGQKIEMNQEFT